MTLMADSGEDVEIQREVEELVARLDETTARLYALIDDLIGSEGADDDSGD